MGLFGFKSKPKTEGGIMDAIRCDEKDFLIWKWRPNASMEVGQSRKENNIRYGSSLRVRPGQAAVFLYQNKGEYDIIKGPYDDIIKTDNMPVLASIVGLAYAGGTPFQAEVYFINLAKGMELSFTIPYFRVIPSEQEYKSYDIQVAVKGTITFEVPSTSEYTKYFLEAWGTTDTQIADLQARMKAPLFQEVKRVVANAPKDTGIFIMHYNSLIGEFGQYIQTRIQDLVAHRFGVIITNVFIEDIRYNEDSESYQNLKYITEKQAHKFNLENEKTALLSYEIQRETMRTDADVRNQNVRETARIQMEHMGDMSARMREESQFAQHMQTEMATKQAGLASESAYINAHALNKQAEVLKSGMENMGQMGAMNLGGGDGHMNPAGMMTGMMMGAAVGGQAANMMNQMGQTMGQSMANAGKPMQSPPPIPVQQNVVYYLAVNGQQYGPCDANAISQMVASGQINADTLGWCEGMAGWQAIKLIPSLASIFARPAGTPPPIPTP